MTHPCLTSSSSSSSHLFLPFFISSGINERIEYTPGSGQRVLFPDAELQLCDIPCETQNVSVRLSLVTNHIGKGCDRDTYSVESQRKLCGQYLISIVFSSLVFFLVFVVVLSPTLSQFSHHVLLREADSVVCFKCLLCCGDRFLVTREIRTDTDRFCIEILPFSCLSTKNSTCPARMRRRLREKRKKT